MDYRDHNRQQVLQLTAIEFFRRFLVHGSPLPLHGILDCGLLAPPFRKPLPKRPEH